MIQNLVWATGYNLIALPLAAGGLYHQGILMNPAAGAVLIYLTIVKSDLVTLGRTLKEYLIQLRIRFKILSQIQDKSFFQWRE